jgi:N-acetylmuramoyl-L-alanine amidase
VNRFLAASVVLGTLVASVAAGESAPTAPSDSTAAQAAPAGHPRAKVVIDPGHGGSNPGATGALPGLHEKQLTLVLARAVRERLVADGIDVVLTRDRDASLTLRRRMSVANQLGADLFVSLHANASPTRTQRGFETFVLTAAGVDVDGRALRSDSGTPRPGVDAETALVLDDVERGAAQWESAELAVAIQRELRAVRGADGDRGVRQDSHHVLLGATMPAVLVEVGFIDHPLEGRELALPAVQAQLADAIAAGIRAQLAARP